jgi:hypothetical protein
MPFINPYPDQYRVLLIGIGKNTEAEKISFCSLLAERFGIPHPLLKKIVDHCPIILKKNLTRKKAQSLARILRSFGAQVSIEVKKILPPISLEFQNLGSPRLILESSLVGRTHSGTWNVVGRVRNVAVDDLNDIWVLIQLFNAREEFLTFEEVPLTLNPLPQGEVSPFRAIFEGEFPVFKISVAFKNSAGNPLAAIDRRSVPEWTKIEWDEGDETALSIDLSIAPQPIPLETPKEELNIEMVDLSPRELQPSDIETPGVLVVEPQEGFKTFSEQIPTEQIKEELLPGKTVKEEQVQEESSLNTPFSQAEEEPSVPFENVKENAPLSTPSENLPFIGERSEAYKGVGEIESGKRPAEEVLQKKPTVLDTLTQLDASVFEEASRLINEISIKEEKREKGSSSFSWIEGFRGSVQTYSQEVPDAFTSWFRARQSQHDLKDPFHSLLTLLVHARFDQMDETEKAIENTQRVYSLIARHPITLDEIPALEGTLFFSEEQWRDLFYRAIPKLQQVGHGILEKKEWKASEIERLIQIIPHVSERLSRKAVRRISRLIPETVKIDFYNHPLLIDPALYRVVSRLGVVDPHFDLYQGKDSMGDLKIQAFAKEAFPQDPSRIEAPMAWMGRNAAGNHCLPSKPECEGCLFEKFCQKLYLQFDPSEKGMGRR